MRALVIALVLSLAACASPVEKVSGRPDLSDSEAVASGNCLHEGEVVVCFLLKKEGRLYLVGVDDEGLIFVRSVKEKKQTYDDIEAPIIWEREPRKPNRNRI